VGERRDEYRGLVGETGVKRLLGRPGRRGGIILKLIFEV
jgi:hypothetical protein